MDEIRIAALPAPLRWANKFIDCEIQEPDTLTMTAGPGTDLFVPPGGGKITLNAPRLTFTCEGDFTLSAHVEADLRAPFDAGDLVVYAGERLWAKLCVELSPDRPAIVSVVTREVSDDCNSVILDTPRAWLRVARMGAVFAFHYSLDGRYWHMVRQFTLGALDAVALGFAAQCSRGESCTAVFSGIAFERRTLGDIRSGE